MKRISPILISLVAFQLAACTANNTGNQAHSEVSSSSEAMMEETKNVLYRGTLEEAGVSIFMQGTHRLSLDDGRFIMLESEQVNLDHYIGEEVEVFGAVRPTVEEGGMIMRVESVKSLTSSLSSSVVIDNNSSASSSEFSSASSSDAASSAATISSSVAQLSSVTAVTTTSSIAASSMAAWQGSAELSAKAAIMAKDKMAPELWTQKYCSTTIGYCIPVHKNWWFNSFGTTSTALWHVEIGTTEMTNLGEGPLVVDVVSGDISASGMTDGQVKAENGMVIGARSWTGNRHIEVRGPSNLEAAIRYITAELKAAQ